MPVVETPRLSLREVSNRDAPFILALMNEPAYHEHIGDRGVRTVADAAKYVSDKFLPSYSKHGYGLYVVEKREDAKPVGICGFVKRDALEHPDIGFAFLKEFESQGFALEAARATLSYGYGALGLKTVLGVTSPGNAPSIRLLERLGFRYQAMIQIPPANRGTMLYSNQGESMKIRAHAFGDDPEWLRLRTALWPELSAAVQRKEMDGWLARTDGIVLVAPHDSGTGLIGFAEVGTRSLADGCETSPLAYLEGWYVDAAFRRTGVGAALVRAAEAWARSKGYREFASDAELENTDSQKAHVSVGFREVERSVLFLKSL